VEAGAGAEAAGAEEVAGVVAEADSEDLAVDRAAEAEPGAVGENNLTRRKKLSRIPNEARRRPATVRERKIPHFADLVRNDGFVFIQ